MRFRTREERVQEFRDAAGKENYFVDNGEDADLICGCIEEEFAEFVEATINYDESDDEENRKQLVKEWADLAYVVSQAAVYYNIPGELAFQVVADNNMTKVVGGKVIFREDGKILKPEGYVPADMSGL